MDSAALSGFAHVLKKNKNSLHSDIEWTCRQVVADAVIAKLAKIVKRH